ncbi:MAG: PQQ-binding-like beta-propeller repeat protein [Clostridiales Family XIII bacterium]|nr:PQQ-binding-like beta-propeller repeat protein [Clostridiales Family XIII bacterium]
MLTSKSITKGISRGKIIAILTVVAVALSCVVPLFIDADNSSAYAAPAANQKSEWPSFRGDPAAKGMTDAPTAKTAKEAKLNWEYKLRKDAGGLLASGPLLVGNNIYLAVTNGEDFMMAQTKPRLVVLNRKGKLVKETAITGVGGADVGMPMSASIGYGAGKIYVPLTDGTICAYDASTLKLKWRSARIAGDGANVISSIIYKGGYIYSGASTGSADKGCFFAIDASNGKIAWRYAAASGKSGYYNAGAAFTDKAVFFAGEDGVLVSHALKSSKVYDTYNLGGPVRCETVAVDSTLYVTTKSGKLYKAPLSKNGRTFDDKRVKSASLFGENCTTEPIVYNNKIYTFSAKEDFGKSVLEVWSVKTLKKKSSVNVGAYINGEPLLTTAYAKKGNGYKVYLYVLQNDVKDDLLMIADSTKMKKPSIRKLYSPGGDYAEGSPIAADDGTIYFYHSVTTSTADWSVYYYDARLVSLGNAAKK